MVAMIMCRKIRIGKEIGKERKTTAKATPEKGNEVLESS